MLEILTKNCKSIVTLNTRFEGSNICTWIGFKHVMYLAEEALLQHFRNNGLWPSKLFENDGLCFEIVDADIRILHALHMDDTVNVEVVSSEMSAINEMLFGITIFSERDNRLHKSCTGKMKVIFRKVPEEIPLSSLATALLPYTVKEIDRARGNESLGLGMAVDRGTTDARDHLIKSLGLAGENFLIWKWHIPYFYCHFTERIQHSGYLRLMEEAVDIYLADRGISIRTFLTTKKWIPVVPHARVEILKEALMEETIYIVYKIEDIFKNLTYTASMDCYVDRNSSLVHAATGKITHGYAKIDSRRDWSLVDFDESTLAALRNQK